ARLIERIVSVATCLFVQHLPRPDRHWSTVSGRMTNMHNASRRDIMPEHHYCNMAGQRLRAVNCPLPVHAYGLQRCGFFDNVFRFCPSGWSRSPYPGTGGERPAGLTV
ncbi:MAG: hypothetical protein ACN6N0_02805, partial [Microvirgula sp.]